MAVLNETFYASLVSSAKTHLALYEAGEEIISDYAYDQLINQIRAIEARNPEWILPDSPTQVVSNAKIVNGDKVIHAARMGSQSNITTPEELRKFCIRIEYLDCSVEPKADGLSLALNYAYGVLVSAPTRGNGLVGGDVYNNAIHAKGVPLNLPIADALAVFHGEVVLSKWSFRHVNETLVSVGKRPYANARAAAAGILQGNGAFTEYLEFILWDVPKLAVALFDGDESHYKRLLRAHYLKIGVNKPKPPTSYENIAKEVEWYIDNRESLDYQIDGVVIKVDDIHARVDFGWSKKCPKWSTAWKFEPSKADTTVTDIGFQVTPQGQVVPIAQVAEVNIDGFSVTSVKMHNLSILRHTGVWIGDKVTVSRLHDVHNEISAVHFEERPADATPPIVPECCPECNTPLIEKGKHTIILQCPNYHGCHGQIIARFVQYLSPNGIKCLFPSVVMASMIRKGRLKDITDLYTIKPEELIKAGCSEKVANNRTWQLAEALKLHPAQHLASLGIPLISRSAANLLMAEWDMDTLVAAALSEPGRESLRTVVSERIVDSLQDFCSNVEGARLLTQLGRLLRE